MFLAYSKRVNDLSGRIFRPVTDIVKGPQYVFRDSGFGLFEDWNSGF